MKLTGMRNQCQGCKQYFNSNHAFDKHRVGKHGSDRRCRTTEEMLELGMSLNSANFWITEKRDDYMDTRSLEQPNTNEG